MAEMPITQTESGAVLGSTDENGVQCFLGIPYAAAPTGSRRFSPPAAVPPWAGVHDARRYGPTAPQPPVDPAITRVLPRLAIPGEDYLNLNVWTPGIDGSRAVMVFIHGGSFTSGSGAIPVYNGARFARDGVVLVTINYRLGADGFLWFGEGTPNLGLLDQIAALAWVRRNIGAFGGDPDNVTVFGESSGAMSICTLMAMPLAAGLFRRAIAQSGAGSCVISPDAALRAGVRLAEMLDVEPTRSAVAKVPVPSLMAAQAQLAQEVAAQTDARRFGDVSHNLMPFEPVVDGEVLPAAPVEAFREGRAAAVQLLIGVNSDEGNLFFVPSGVVELADRAALSGFVRARGYPESIIAAYRASRPRDTDGQLISAIMTDGFYWLPALELARLHPGTHVYEFGWRSPAFDGALGACHALELPFVFDALDDAGYALLLGDSPPPPQRGDSPPQRLADAMHNAWIAFATDGRPGWPPYDGERRLLMRFDIADSVGQFAAERSRELAVWER